MSTVEAGKVVSIHYVLRDDAGQELDRSEEGSPMFYLHGAQNIVAGLEEKLTGAAIGAKVSVTVPPEKGYGPRNRGKVFQIPRSALPATVTPTRGMQLYANGPDNQKVPVFITKVQGPTITVDPNHPLAGVTLHFDVTVVDVRDATDEEKTHGHAHGPDGHGHGH